MSHSSQFGILKTSTEPLIRGVGRDVGIDRERHVLPAQEQADPASGNVSGASISRFYLGLGLGVGGAVVLGLAVLVILIARKRKEHRRMIEAVQVEDAVQASEINRTPDFARLSIANPRNSFHPLNTRAGWGALSSGETLNEPDAVPRTYDPNRASSSLSKKLKKGGIRLKTLKRLTAILESPRVKTPDFPRTIELDATKVSDTTKPKAFILLQPDEHDVFVSPGSPKPSVLPSFAIRSPGRYGAGIANGKSRQGNRSHSVGEIAVAASSTPPGWSSRTWPNSVHARSVSLYAPPGRPPSGPVPPIPADDPENPAAQESVRKGFRIQRMSSSSQESSHNSELVATPILTASAKDQGLGSPTVEEVVAEDDQASLKMVRKNRWHDPLAGVSASLAGDREGNKAHASVRANIGRSSAQSFEGHRLSSGSSGSAHNRVDVARVGTADEISISRVSSSSSVPGSLGVRKVITPKRVPRTSVSASGSPLERKRTGILRDISGNSLGPSRQASIATEDSNRSSNGNPFQWDQPLTKPSALKGSPNARKGHRRQNCVRISTLTPQILGPPPSRSTSPSIMHGIEEESGESGDGNETAMQPGTRFVSNQRLSRPPSASSFAPRLRTQPVRASLTPSSPTISTWAAFQQHGLPSRDSDSQRSNSVDSRSASRLSNRSSAFGIPSFPSPVRAATSTTQLCRPIPQFYLSRPSTDADEGESVPFASILPSESPILSSLPLPTSKRDEYDPAWRMPRIEDMSVYKYDPASPARPPPESQRSSASLSFATSQPSDRDVSHDIKETPLGHFLRATPQKSPNVMPEGFRGFFERNHAESESSGVRDDLTSANASSMLADLSTKVDFPGAPVLSPPKQDVGYDRIAPKTKTSQYRWSYMVPKRPAPMPPTSIDYQCVPSPLHIGIKANLNGPRSQPANSVLKNAIALRRMNSEIDTTANRETRRFLQLGREASPLLPWIGSPEVDESRNNINNFSDFDFGEAGTTVVGAENDDGELDELDTLAVEAKLEGALVGLGVISSDGISSVWEDGERYWGPEQRLGRIPLADIDPLTLSTTPQKQAAAAESPRSIQCTPKSLYDSDGFLRT